MWRRHSCLRVAEGDRDAMWRRHSCLRVAEGDRGFRRWYQAWFRGILAAMRAPPDGYRRDLPHLQSDGATIFVTFSTMKRLIVLPPEARDITLEHLLFENDRKHHVHIAVVMPEHVHMITTPLTGADGRFLLSEIMKPIKGVSSRRINKVMRRSGSLWQDESFDHILRNDESLQQKADYVAMNPVRRGLVSSPDEYPWLWRDWVEGSRRDSR